MGLVYEPAEDSFLLEKIILNEVSILANNNSDLNFLEVGIGSGIQLKAAEKAGVKKNNIFGCDINFTAVENCKKLGYNCIVSNLFENINESFDVIVFNPPYLPKNKIEDSESQIITTGGKLGSEIPNDFLEQAKKHLKKEGRIFLLVSSLTKGLDFSSFQKKIIGEEKLFFEKLIVYELK